MFVRDVRNQDDVEKLMRNIGVTDEGVLYMRGKGVLRIVQISDLDTRGANVLKQEALAIGADLALPRSAAAFSEKKVDAVLIANDKQIAKLVAKLKIQPFGLKEVALRLVRLSVDYDKEEFKLVSPHGRELVLDKPAVMGVLNVTPDSFSDGGRFCSSSLVSREASDSQNLDVDAAVKCAREMITEGAAIIDIGGESTGPGSFDVSSEEELKRVIPVIEAVRKDLPNVFLSVDTYKAEVASLAVSVGVDMVNDVTAGRGDESMFDAVSDMKVPIVLMYAKDDTPRTTSEKVEYDDVMKTVIEFLESRIEVLGSGNQIVVDPGMGAFVSSDPEYSLEILKRLSELRSLGKPIMVGASRKSFLGGDIDDRLESSIAAAVVAAGNGAGIIRAHDVQETVKALKICL